MLCPKCHHDTFVLDSRSRTNNTIWRRRQCLHCQYRFTTTEDFLKESDRATFDSFVDPEPDSDATLLPHVSPMGRPVDPNNWSVHSNPGELGKPGTI